MEPLIIEPMPPIMPLPPSVETNSSTTIAPTRNPRRIFKPSLMAYYTSFAMLLFRIPKYPKRSLYRQEQNRLFG